MWLVGWLGSLLMIFGPVVGYIPQYIKIQRTGSSEGFSTFVSLILFVSNILRLFFWIGKRYEVTLVWQSVIMILAQILLLDVCVWTENLNNLGRKRRRLREFFIQDFWNWGDLADYMTFLGIFSIGIAGLCHLFLRQSWFIEVLGFTSLGCEACLTVPQVWRNFINKSTTGLSTVLVFCWFGGDAIKSIYFVSTDAPVQFLFCGVSQILLDLIIYAQIFLYKGKV